MYSTYHILLCFLIFSAYSYLYPQDIRKSNPSGHFYVFQSNMDGSDSKDDDIRPELIMLDRELLWKIQREKIFILPNEENQTEGRQLYSKIGKGVFISVGTERGFFGFVMTGATHLLLIDKDPHVVLYNRINVALLALSTSIRDFEHLKRNATFEEWKSRVRSVKVHKYFKYLEDPRFYNFFRICGDAHGEKPFAILYGERSFFVSGPFSGVNYHMEKEQYKKASKAAKKEKIEVYMIDLFEPEFEELVRSLPRGLLLAGVDISNVMFSKIWGEEESKSGERIGKDTIGMMNRIYRSNPNSIIIATNSMGSGNYWNYYGFTVRYLLQDIVVSFLSGEKKVDRSTGLVGSLRTGLESSVFYKMAAATGQIKTKLDAPDLIERKPFSISSELFIALSDVMDRCKKEKLFEKEEAPKKRRWRSFF